MESFCFTPAGVANADGQTSTYVRRNTTPIKSMASGPRNNDSKFWAHKQDIRPLAPAPSFVENLSRRGMRLARHIYLSQSLDRYGHQEGRHRVLHPALNKNQFSVSTQNKRQTSTPKSKTQYWPEPTPYDQNWSFSPSNSQGPTST